MCFVSFVSKMGEHFADNFHDRPTWKLPCHTCSIVWRNITVLSALKEWLDYSLYRWIRYDANEWGDTLTESNFPMRFDKFKTEWLMISMRNFWMWEIRIDTTILGNNSRWIVPIVEKSKYFPLDCKSCSCDFSLSLDGLFNQMDCFTCSTCNPNYFHIHIQVVEHRKGLQEGVGCMQSDWRELIKENKMMILYKQVVYE